MADNNGLTFGFTSGKVITTCLGKMKRIRWSAKLAYAVGLITTDGCLSKDSRHIILVSKDIDQLETFIAIFKLKNKISHHSSGYNPRGNYYHVQFGNVVLYKFLLQIGLTPNKTKTIGALRVPKGFFADFLRGHLDGDGNISIVRHHESQHPQLRLRFSSASLSHLEWIKKLVSQNYNISGGFINETQKNMYYLTYAKADSIKLLELIYYNGVKYYLRRKLHYYLTMMGEWRNRYTREF